MPQPQLHPHRFADAGNAMAYLQGGHARLTVRSLRTQTRYTYEVRESDDGKCFFVGVLFGSENTSDYVYMGIIRNGRFQSTRKSKVQPTDKRFVAFQWIYSKLGAGVLPADVEVWHEGTCCRCGRALTVPESIASGIGPECARKRGLRTAPPEPVPSDIPWEDNVVPLNRRSQA
jgi:hypothetical protein